VRLALVSFGVAGAVAVPAANAFADGSPSPAPTASASGSPKLPSELANRIQAQHKAGCDALTKLVNGGKAKPSTVELQKALCAAAASGSLRVPGLALPTPTGSPEVRTVPKGAAQTGEGPVSGSPADLAVGTGLAASGAAALGIAALRRRAGARG
jgi:hypothetical protein